MSFLTDDDIDAPIQSHFDELTLRFTILFISALLCIFLWSVFIDDILQKIVTFFSVCDDACLNIYDPTQWSRIRWFSSILLGVFSVLPLALYHTYQFSKTGLLPQEKRMLKIWLVCAFTSLPFTIITSLYTLEFIFEYGHQNQLEFGLQPKYDMIMMLSYWTNLTLFLFLFWMTMATFGLLSVFKILTVESMSLWLTRILGLGSLLIVTSFPAQEFQIALYTAICYVVGSTIIIRTLFKPHRSNGMVHDILDAEGRRIRGLIVDCSCDGAMNHSNLIQPSGMKLIQTTSICTSPESRNAVMHDLIHHQCTHLLVTGCDMMACPQQFADNSQRLRISNIGLNLHSISNRRGEQSIRQQDFDNVFATTEEIYGHKSATNKYEEMKAKYGDRIRVEVEQQNYPLLLDEHVVRITTK